MSTSWFYTRDDNRFGPVSSRRLKELAASGELLPSDMLWTDGMAESVPASRLGLNAECGDQGVLPPPLPVGSSKATAAVLQPQSQASGVVASTHDPPLVSGKSNSAASRQGRKVSLFAWITAVAIAIVAVAGGFYLLRHQSNNGTTPKASANTAGEEGAISASSPSITTAQSILPPAAPQRAARSSPDHHDDPSPPSNETDLLGLIDPSRHAIKGNWWIEDNWLHSDGAEPALLQIPYEPPDEYALEVNGEIAGPTVVLVGLAAQGRQFLPVLNWKEQNGRVTRFLAYMDGEKIGQESIREGQVVPESGPYTLRFEVRRNRVLATVNGKMAIDWTGDFSRLSNSPLYEVPNKRALFLGGWRTPARISSITITPLAGQE